MAEAINENVNQVIKQAIKEGIGAGVIGKYLKLTKVPVGNDKDIMDKLYQENNVYPSELALLGDVDSTIEVIHNELIEAGEVQAVVNVEENNEEKALVAPEQKGIFSAIGTLFSNIWKSIKAYVNEMQVIEVKEEINVTEQEYVVEEVSQSVA